MGEGKKKIIPQTDKIDFPALQEVKRFSPIEIKGTIIKVKSEVLEVEIPGGVNAQLISFGSSGIGEIINCSGRSCTVAPITAGLLLSVRVGGSCKLLLDSDQFIIGEAILGSVVGACFEELYRFSKNEAPADSETDRLNPQRVGYHKCSPSPFERTEIRQQLVTGIKAIDAFVPIGVGQRLAVIAEPGVGKSSLLQALALRANADVSVIALIGERGREVGEFVAAIEAAGFGSKVVIVSATSDECAARRKYAALAAQRIAEYFRDQGKSVLLLVDSLSRWARSMRDLSAACGDKPVRKGYSAETFTALPRLLERAGTSSHGAITALYTILATSDLDEDPMVEEVRSLTDGHILLSRSRSERGIYPAVDILRSLSRVASSIVTKEFLGTIGAIKRLLSYAERDKDLVLLGGNTNSELTAAIELERKTDEFVSQYGNEYVDLEKTKLWVISRAKAISRQPSEI